MDRDTIIPIDYRHILANISGQILSALPVNIQDFFSHLCLPFLGGHVATSAECFTSISLTEILFFSYLKRFL